MFDLDGLPALTRAELEAVAGGDGPAGPLPAKSSGSSGGGNSSTASGKGR